MTIEKLSSAANVSYATVCRMCNCLGYDGYKDFKETLKNSLKENSVIDEKLIKDIEIFKNISFSDISAQICELSTTIIKNCNLIIKNQKNKSINEAVELILSSKFVYFLGVGASAISANYAYVRLFRTGIGCAYDHDATIRKMKCSLLGKNDLLFAISSSGRTKSIIDAVNIAKSNGAKVISLCDFAVAPLTKLADINFYTTARDVNYFTNDDMQLIIGQINLIDILYFCCRSRSKSADSFFEKTKKAAETDKTI